MRDHAATSAVDRSLVEAVLNRGDERAFRRLYRSHTPRLYLFVLRLVGGIEEDAEDVVQETWVRAFRSLDRFRWESGFSTWLHAIGINVAKNSIRRRTRRREEAVDDCPELVARRRTPLVRIDLERAISDLPDGCREIFVLYDIEGLRHREIAEHLGISEGTSKSQVHIARRRLRAALEAKGESNDEPR